MESQSREVVNPWKKVLLGAAIALAVAVPVGVGVLNVPRLQARSPLGGSAGSGLQIDAPNFCCPDYLVQMMDRIRTNWVQQAESAGTNVVKCTIQRDGQIVDVVLEQSSGFQNLDLSSQRALVVTKTLNPLPAAFPNPTLTVHLNFQYQR